MPIVYMLNEFKTLSLLTKCEVYGPSMNCLARSKYFDNPTHFLYKFSISWFVFILFNGNFLFRFASLRFMYFTDDFVGMILKLDIHE